MKLKNNSVVNPLSKSKNTSKCHLQQKIKKAPKGFKINWREYVRIELTRRGLSTATQF